MSQAGPLGALLLPYLDGQHDRAQRVQLDVLVVQVGDAVHAGRLVARDPLASGCRLTSATTGGAYECSSISVPLCENALSSAG